jgi:alanine racemase
MKWLKNLLKKRFLYKPLINIYIDKSAILHNIERFLSISPKNSIIPVLKSNAYGHGLIEVAKIITDYRKNKPNTIPRLAIDSYFEAIALRSSGIKTPLLIVGYTRPEDIIRSKLDNIDYTITSLEQLKKLISLPRHYKRKKINLQIKLDTGMHRQGITESQIGEVINILKNNPWINLVGIFSHLCDADNTDKSFTNKQVEIWHKCLNIFKKHFPNIKYWHISATDGHALDKKIESNISRVGIGLYGLSANANIHNSLNLRPTLEMKTIITGIKNIKAGEGLGYSQTFIAKNDMRIATIPVGYFEGLDTRLSNKGVVLVKKIECPIIGRVSMNITIIDVSNIKDIELEQEVVVISSKYEHDNSINNIAKMIGSISYEVAVKIPQHLRRVIF